MSFKLLRGWAPGQSSNRGGDVAENLAFISSYLTGRTLSLMLCALLAGCIVLRLSAKATAAVSIKRSEHLTLDSTKMYLLTRSADRSAPVLLWWNVRTSPWM